MKTVKFGQLKKWVGAPWALVRRCLRQFDYARRTRLRTRRQRIVAFLLALVILAGVIVPALIWDRQAEAWWNSGTWGFRRQITFDNSASARPLLDFPVRVSLTSGEIDYSDTQNAGQDIRFVDTDGKVLSHEIEVWNESGTSEVWVKVPQIDAASTTDSIWMYYGNTGALDGQDPSGVWSSEYRGVWHTKEASGTRITDSTANKNNGTLSGAVITTSGKIGSANDYDGTNDYMNAGSASSLDNLYAQGGGGFTVSAWIRADTTATGNLGQIVNKAPDATPSTGWFFRTVGTGNRLGVRQAFSTTDTFAVTVDNAIVDTTWAHVAATYTGSANALNMEIYVDGVKITSMSTTQNGTGTLDGDAANNLVLGCDIAVTTDQCFDGQIDEMRVSNIVLDADQIEASYISTNNAMNSFGSEQSGTYSPEGEWSYRRKITFNNIPSASNLSNFPIRVALDSSRIDYSVMQDGGQDIRFVDSNDTTVLDHEIEIWRKNGKSEVWVEVPQIDAGTRTDYIWMYYGNGYASDGQEVAGVWDSSYRGVWHMKESNNATTTDSTANANHGAYTNGAAYDAAGKIGNASSFDGSNDNISAGTDTSLDNLTGQGGGGMTISAWQYKARHPGGNNTYGLLATKGSSFSAGGWNLRTFRTNTAANTYEYYEPFTTGHTIGSYGNVTGAANQSGYLDKQWSYVAATGQGNLLGTTLNMFIDGKEIQAYLQRANGTGSLADDSANSLLFGCDPPSTANRCHAGLIDEIRISNVVRSADWINAEYRSTNDSMATYGREEMNTGGPLGSWYDSCYTYRRKITFNNGNSATDLQNFPVRVSLNSGNIDYASTQNSGQDIRFTDNDGVKLLSHQIEVWDESGTSEVWVRVPQVDAASTTDFIWMYYGCGSASDGQQAAGVWANNYRGVWHMNGTSGSEADSTAYAANGTVTGSPTRGSAGKIGNAYDFPGSNGNYLDIGDPAGGHLDFDAASFTYNAWAKLDSATGDNQAILTKGGIATDTGYTIVGSTAAVISGRIYDGTTAVSSGNITPSLPSDWIHVTVVVDRVNQLIRIYNNGVEVGSGTAISTVNSLNTAFALTIGDRSANDPTDGKIDDVRINNGIRSADWIEAEYMAGNNTLNTIGSQQTIPVTPATDAWCNDTSGVSCTSDWASRKAVRIINGQTSENLTDFPILIRLDSTSIDYAKTQNSGQDIRFVDPANPSVVLAHQIERWDESGSSSVWVKVPQIDKESNSDYLLMYYNNPSVSDGQDASNVWSSGYNIVYHMDESSGSLSDSAGSAQNATRNGGVTQAAGKIGYAQDFNNSTGYTNTPSPALPTGNATYELWVLGDVGDSDNTLVMVSDGTGGAANEVRIYAGPTATEWSAHIRTIQIPWLMNDTRWVHVTATRVGVDMYVYEDGQLAGLNSSVSGFDFTANCDMFLGTDVDANCSGSLGNYLGGLLDEFRVSTGHSSEWVYANYLSNSDSMVTFDSEEYGSIPAPTLTAFSGGVSTTPTFQLRGYDPNSPSYLRYKIDVCSNSDCSTVVRTIDQTASQTGWSGQDAQTSTAYVAGATVGASTLASHAYQTPALTAGTTYYWRGYAIDPSGDNTWSGASAIQSFTTAGSPSVPTLEEPIGGASAPKQPVFRMRSTDPNQDYLQYKIDVCADSGCSSIIRTIDQTSSQTGWLAQGAQSGTAYNSSASAVNLSNQAMHVYQTPSLTAGTTYWWRAYAIDPGGSNAWTAASSTSSFMVNPDGVRITGGTRVTGGSSINN
jgi:hypothetical protein